MALPKYIYPRMQPTDHISTAFVYLEEPNNISGALYQRVATYSVIIGSLTDWLTVAMERASPKSASLARQSESRRMFEGLRSLWMSSPECIYLIALRTLDVKRGTGRGRIFCGHFPWYWLWWLRADRFPWNQKRGRYLYCFRLSECWVGIRCEDVRWVTAKRWPGLAIWYFSVGALGIRCVLKGIENLL